MAIDIGYVGSSSSDKSADFEEFAGMPAPRTSRSVCHSGQARGNSPARIPKSFDARSLNTRLFFRIREARRIQTTHVGVKPILRVCFRTGTHWPVSAPSPHWRRDFREGLGCGEEGRGEGFRACDVAPSPQPSPPQWSPLRKPCRLWGRGGRITRLPTFLMHTPILLWSPSHVCCT